MNLLMSSVSTHLVMRLGTSFVSYSCSRTRSMFSSRLPQIIVIILSVD